MNRSTNFATNTGIPFKNYTIWENNKRSTWPLVWWWVLTQQKKPTYPIRNIHYFKHWLLQFYTFTLRRTFFQRTKGHSVKWTSDHPTLPGNREEKTPSGVILQQEVLVRNKELTAPTNQDSGEVSKRSTRDGRLQSRGPSNFHLATKTQHSQNEFSVTKK